MFNPDGKKKIIFLVGPTAVGKSALAIKLAKRINGEIVACDSMQVYKGVDILSSKPSPLVQKTIRHYLLDVVLPKKEFNVAAYRSLALKAIRVILKRGRIPLFVGGTGLYMKVVIEGIFKGAKKDLSLRNRLYAKGVRFGSVYLHSQLEKVDPEAASRIHPNDLKRIIRALEVYQLTGKPISELKKKRRGLQDKYDITVLGLNKDRQALYRDINQHVDEMFNQGLVREVKGLLRQRLSLTCSQAIGIREIRDYLDGKSSLEEARELIKQNTRHYAKRQRTWFRKDKRILWFDSKDKTVINKILEKIKG